MRYPCGPAKCWAAVLASAVCVPICVFLAGKAACHHWCDGLLERDLIDRFAQEHEREIPTGDPEEWEFRRMIRTQDARCRQFEESLKAIEEKGLLNAIVLKRLLNATGDSRFYLGAYLVPRIPPGDAVIVVRDWWPRCRDLQRKRCVLMALGIKGHPGYADLFADFVLHEDKAIRSAATYGLFRCNRRDLFLTCAVRSLEKGLALDYYGTDEIIHHEDPDWDSAAAYFSQCHSAADEVALTHLLQRQLPTFIKRDILRALVEMKTSTSLKYCRSSISPEEDDTVWKYMALVILRYGKRQERLDLLLQIPRLEEPRASLLAELVAEELSHFRLPLGLVETRPALAAAVVRVLKESGKFSGSHGHILDHLHRAATQYGSGQLGDLLEIREVDLRGEIEAKMKTEDSSRSSVKGDLPGEDGSEPEARSGPPLDLESLD